MEIKDNEVIKVAIYSRDHKREDKAHKIMMGQYYSSLVKTNKL